MALRGIHQFSVSHSDLINILKRLSCVFIPIGEGRLKCIYSVSENDLLLPWYFLACCKDFLKNR